MQECEKMRFGNLHWNESLELTDYCHVTQKKSLHNILGTLHILFVQNRILLLIG